MADPDRVALELEMQPAPEQRSSGPFSRADRYVGLDAKGEQDRAKRRRRQMAAGVLALLLVVGGALLWWQVEQAGATSATFTLVAVDDPCAETVTFAVDMELANPSWLSLSVAPDDLRVRAAAGGAVAVSVDFEATDVPPGQHARSVAGSFAAVNETMLGRWLRSAVAGELGMPEDAAEAAAAALEFAGHLVVDSSILGVPVQRRIDVASLWESSSTGSGAGGQAGQDSDDTSLADDAVDVAQADVDVGSVDGGEPSVHVDVLASVFLADAVPLVVREPLPTISVWFGGQPALRLGVGSGGDDDDESDMVAFAVDAAADELGALAELASCFYDGAACAAPLATDGAEACTATGVLDAAQLYFYGEGSASQAALEPLSVVVDAAEVSLAADMHAPRLLRSIAFDGARAIDLVVDGNATAVASARASLARHATVADAVSLRLSVSAASAPGVSTEEVAARFASAALVEAAAGADHWQLYPPPTGDTLHYATGGNGTSAWAEASIDVGSHTWLDAFHTLTVEWAYAGDAVGALNVTIPRASAVLFTDPAARAVSVLAAGGEVTVPAALDAQLAEEHLRAQWNVTLANEGGIIVEGSERLDVTVSVCALDGTLALDVHNFLPVDMLVHRIEGPVDYVDADGFCVTPFLCYDPATRELLAVAQDVEWELPADSVTTHELDLAIALSVEDCARVVDEIASADGLDMLAAVELTLEVAGQVFELPVEFEYVMG